MRHSGDKTTMNMATILPPCNAPSENNTENETRKDLMTMRGTLNNGIITYQEQRRQDTLGRIKYALDRRRAAGLPLTKSGIADDIGMSISSFRAPYIQAYIADYMANIGDVTTQSIEELDELNVCKIQLLKANEDNRHLRLEIRELKHKQTELLTEYSKLFNTLSK